MSDQHRLGWRFERPSLLQRFALPLAFVAGGIVFLTVPSLLARGASAERRPVQRSATGPAFGYRDVGPVDIFRAGDLRAALQQMQSESRGVTFPTSEDGRARFVLNRREAPSEPEMHGEWDDVFIVQAGRGMLYYGGRLAGAVSTRSTESRAERLEGARALELNAGDVVRIPAGVPHVVAPYGDVPIVYLVVKNRARGTPVTATVEYGPTTSGKFVGKDSSGHR